MKSLVLCLLLLASCTATEVGNTLLPDEFTYGQGSASSSMSGKVSPFRGDDSLPMQSDEEGESTYAALTWHLPSLDEGLSRADRNRIRSESIILHQQTEEMSEEETLGDGATFKADSRHAITFASIIGLLLIFLLIKLRRSNGWH